MPILDDVTTGSPDKAKIRKLIEKNTGSTSSVPDPVLAPAPASNEPARSRFDTQVFAESTGRHDESMTLRAPGVHKSIMDEIAMRAGALSSVPEVEDAMDTGWQTYEPPDTDSEFENFPVAPGARAGVPTAPIKEYASTEEADARAERTRRKALGEGGMRKGARTLDSEDYKELSKQQKAAVDLNELLIRATRQDKRNQDDDVPEAQAKEYEDAVDRVFGTDEKSDTYAPRTVELLESIGFSSDDVDLDQMLKMRLGFTGNELKSVGQEDKGGPDASLLTPEKLRSDLQESLLEDFVGAREDQAQGQYVRQAQRSLLGVDKMAGNRVPWAPGMLPENVDQYMQASLWTLAQPKLAKDPKLNPQAVMADAKSRLTDDEFKAFLQFLDVSTREAMQYRRPLFDDPEIEFSLPRDLRKQLGF